MIKMVRGGPLTIVEPKDGMPGKGHESSSMEQIKVRVISEKTLKVRPIGEK